VSDVTSESRLVRATVDLNLCVGSTLCVQLAPDQFALTEAGQSRVCGEGSCKTILEAAEACPLMAITVRDSASGEVLFP